MSLRGSRLSNRFCCRTTALPPDFHGSSAAALHNQFTSKLGRSLPAAVQDHTVIEDFALNLQKKVAGSSGQRVYSGQQSSPTRTASMSPIALTTSQQSTR